jgi:hypothetical protein
VHKGFSIGLGLNISGAFKDMAADLRWRVLATRPRVMKEVSVHLGVRATTLQN